MTVCLPSASNVLPSVVSVCFIVAYRSSTACCSEGLRVCTLVFAFAFEVTAVGVVAGTLAEGGEAGEGADCLPAP